MFKAMIKNSLKITVFIYVLLNVSSVRAQAVLADYGVPWLVETGIGIVKDYADPKFCPNYGCQFVLGLLALQNNNIQNGFTKHLQDKVASHVQHLYNDAFSQDRTEVADAFQSSMQRLRSASTKAHSTESIKSRMTLAQWLPVVDSLFDLAKDKNPQEAARLVAYAAFLIGTFFPEYSGTDEEIFSKPHLLFKNQIVSQGQVLEALKAYEDWTGEELPLQNRLFDLFYAWQTGEEPKTVNASLPTSNRPLTIAVTAAILTPGLVGYNPNLIGSTFVSTLNQNMAEALTRSQVLDLAAHARRSVQRIGMSPSNITSDSYERHKDRQFAITQAWSELGMMMRTNTWRYLAVLVPQLVQISKEENTQKRAAMLASVLSYIRQYNPEYGAQDRFMKMSFEAVFGDFGFVTAEFLEAFEGNLRWLDPGFETHVEVRKYYNMALGIETLSLFQAKEGVWATSLGLLKATGLPLPSFGLSWFAEAVNTGIKISLVNKLPIFFRETYDRILGTIIRGVGEPAKNDIQQAINDAVREGNKTNAETQLSIGAAQLNGRIGPDAQMARAIYERLLPTLMHILDTGRQAYEQGQLERSARTVVYFAELLETVYPEAPTRDILLANLLKERIGQYVDEQQLASHLEALLWEPTSLNCHIRQRLFVAGLIEQDCLALTETETETSWSTLGFEAAYYAVTAAAWVLPGAVAVLKARSGDLVQNYWAKKSLWAAVGMGATSVFNGISKGLMDKTRSTAQRWTQYAFIEERLDETENWGKAHNLFSARQLELQRILTSNAQEGRKDLIVVMGNWALNFRKTMPDYTTFEEFLKTPLGKDYAEGKEVLEVFFCSMKDAIGNK